jgi:hypothetical protein
LLLLAACHRPDASRNDGGANDTVVPTSALERAALNAGVITNSAKVSVPGLYQRRHEAGVDTLCVAPGKDRRYDFGMEAVFGTAQYCRGGGTARRVGDKLILHFSGRSQCIIVAQYDGDRVALPGVVDVKCADLCIGRGSLEGVTFPRLPFGAEARKQVIDHDGGPICPDQ